ncbi:MAG: SGNH/GDSL hydrolase family protein [Pseudomonadota bacterium]
MRSFFSNIAITLLSVIFVIVLLIGVDRIYGKIIFPNKPQLNLALPANKEVKYKTNEFNIKMHINSLGFRGPEISAYPQSDTYRIIAIGDSFTLGWGVNYEEIWFQKLEKELQTKTSKKIEAIGLAKVGLSYREYVPLVKRAVKYLHPNLIIIGTLAGDDLLHSAMPVHEFLPLIIGDFRPPWPTESSFIAKVEYVVNHWLFPNLKFLFTQDVFKRQAKSGGRQLAIQRLSAQSKERWEQLNSEIKELYLSGNIDSATISTALKRPDELQKAFDPNNQMYQDGKKAMEASLQEMKQDCAANNIQLVVVGIPPSYYISLKQLKFIQGLGFILDDNILDSDILDSTIASVCAKLNIPFYSPTEVFRASNEDLYFYYDQHFNPKGHLKFAQTIGPFVLENIREN